MNRGNDPKLSVDYNRLKNPFKKSKFIRNDHQKGQMTDV